MAKSKADREQEVFEEASRRLRTIVDGCQDDRELSLEDRRFYSISGAQWEGAVGDQFANRPKIEVNKVLLAITRIFNEYRNNRVSARFLPKGGTINNELADFVAGLYRADQQDSIADEALDNAFEEAVGGGFGGFRLTNDYEDEYDEDNERQRIMWEPIPDADSCLYFDSGAKRQDKSDAGFAFLLTGMTREAFESQYPEHEVSSWERPVDDSYFDWEQPELIYVGEYYVVEEKNQRVYFYRTIDGQTEKYTQKQFDENEGLAARLNGMGTVRVGMRDLKRRKIRKWIMSGAGVIEDCGHIAGTEIPLVPVYGKRWFVDGKERFMGHVRPVKDAQRLKNMQVSTLAESAARGGEELPIFTPEQIQGHEQVWANSAVERPAFLVVNPIEVDGQEAPTGPLDYTRTPTVPAAMAALLQMTDADISELLGGQEAGDEIEANLSGKAVELVQNRLDMQSFIYMSNFAKAERRAAEIWLSMAAELYKAEDYSAKIIKDDDKPDFVQMDETEMDEDTGKPVRKYDLTRAKFDVDVDIGPTSASKRSATVRALTQMLPLLADPQDQAVVSAMTLMNMEGEGIEPTRKWFRQKLIAMGVIEPTKEEQKEIEEAQASEPQQPDPQGIYLMAEAQKAGAQAQESQARTMKAVADTEKAEAETIKTLADIDREAQEQALDAFKALQDAATTPPQ